MTFAKGELQRLQLEDDQLVMSPKGNIQLDPAETQALFLSLCQEGQLNVINSEGLRAFGLIDVFNQEAPGQTCFVFGG